MNKFDQSVPKAPGFPFKEATKESPEFIYPAIVATLVVPVIAGFLSFLGIALFCWGVGLSIRWALSLSGISILVVGVYWIANNEKVMFRVESILGIDINQDNIIGQPQHVPHIVVEAQQEEGMNSWVLADLPGDRQVIAAWIQDACKRKSLAVELWEPRFGYTTSKYGTKVAVYSLFKKCLDDREWIIDRGSHGIILSNEGRRVLGNALEQLQVPLLTDGGEDGP